MRMSNSGDYDSAPFEITPQDMAIIFDEFDIGVRKRAEILERLWEQDRWILPEKYAAASEKSRFLKDVYYQIDYLYNKEEIDESIKAVQKNAEELGYNIEPDTLTEDELGISEFFKILWIKIRYINTGGYTRAKIRTILRKYHYKRRSARFCEYFERCLKFYNMETLVNSIECDFRTVDIDTMVTFRRAGTVKKEE